MLNKIAAASGNSIALNSFQSFTLSEGLLAKVVEAIKSGEKDARSSGVVKSFEVFYKGFRQNIAIGRIYIVPSRVCDNREDFPVALLYGTVVREFNLGEETADLITNRIGDSEFDEYSKADYQTLKDKLFTGADGKVTSLILYAPHWMNVREYTGFKYVSDDGELSNLVRHLVFSSYFNPAVSSAFDALMTNVDTMKFDVVDITPKLTYPFITQNPLKAYPDLNKVANSKTKIFLTTKTADAIAQETLEPSEMDVFEALDSALTEATLPKTDSMEEVADFKGPGGSNEGNLEIPQITIDGEGVQHRPDYGTKESSAKKAEREHEWSKIVLSPSDVEYANRTGQKGFQVGETAWFNEISREFHKVTPPDENITASRQKSSARKGASDEPSTKGEAPIGIDLDETGLPEHKVASEIMRDLDTGYVAMSSKAKAALDKREAEMNKKYANRKQADVPLTIDSIWDDLTEDFGEAPQVNLPGEGSSKSESKSEPAEPKSEKSKSEPVEKSVENVEKSETESTEPASEPSDEEPKAEEKTGPKSKLFQDKTANEVQPDAEAKSEVVNPDTIDADINQPTKSVEEAAKVAASGPLPYACYILDDTGQTEYAMVSTSVKECDQFFKDNGVDLAQVEVDDHNPCVTQFIFKAAADKHKHKCPECSKTLTCNNPKDCPGKGKPALCGSCPKKKKSADVNSDISEAKSELDGSKTELADSPEVVKTIDPAHFAAVKKATGGDDLTIGYIEAALWSSSDESTPAGGEPLDKNYGPQDIAPETMAEMVADCEKFKNENAENIRDCTRGSGEYSVEAQAGHDFWLTRNGHGAGFWDGDWPETGDELTAAAKAFGVYDLYVGDDGRIYGSGSTRANRVEDSHIAAGEEYEITPRTRELAQRLIQLDDDIIYDVASNVGQIVGNVKHMPWFLEAVAKEIAGTEDEVEQHLDELDAIAHSADPEEDVPEQHNSDSDKEGAFCDRCMSYHSSRRCPDDDFEMRASADGSPDFSLQNEGSIFVLTPISEEAVNWVSEHIPEDATMWGEGVVIEHRYIGPIIEGIENEGLTLNNESTHTAAAGDENDEAEEMTLEFGDLADLAPSLPSITANITGSFKLAGKTGSY